MTAAGAGAHVVASTSMLQHFLGPPFPTNNALLAAAEIDGGAQCPAVDATTLATAFDAASDVTDRWCPTGDATLDACLGGGFQQSAVTEIFGEAGCGKTQILLQLAVVSAARGETVLFLTSEALPHGRLGQLADAHAAVLGIEAERILASILISRVPSEDHLLMLLQPGGVADGQCAASRAIGGRGRHSAGRGGVRLVLLDSIAACCTDPMMAERAGYCIRAFASRSGVAFVVSNQVRSRPGATSRSGADDAMHTVVASLGLGWSNALHMRIGLERQSIVAPDGDGRLSSRVRRTCRSVFSSHAAPFRLEYSIDNAGVHFMPHCCRHSR